MKKFCFIACICAGIVFTGCKKDSIETSSVSSIVAKNVDKKVDLDKVKVVIDYDAVVAEGNFKNNGFTINLPENVSNNYLEDISYEMPKGIKVSDASAKIGFIEIEGYKSDEYVDDFAYGKIMLDGKKFSIVVGLYVYVDKNVKITGSYTEEDGVTLNTTFSVSLKKGWNNMFVTFSGQEGSNTMTAKWTTSDPGGLEWYFGNSDLKSLRLEPEAKLLLKNQKLLSKFKLF